MNIRPMTADDYAAVMALMSGTPGIAVRAADSPEAVARYLSLIHISEPTRPY